MPHSSATRYSFYEFFSGGGMARLGLGASWNCLFANDNCSKKADSYRANFGPADDLLVGDIERVASHQLPGRADMLWASFPCQDLSLAGSGAGLAGKRSGAFWGFWRLATALIAEHRKPKLIVLENVEGAITSHSGKDFQAIIDGLVSQSYAVGAMVMDAVHFLPQSRPRLFIVAIDRALPLNPACLRSGPDGLWQGEAIRKAHAALPPTLQDQWLWYAMPAATKPIQTFADVIEDSPNATRWHTAQETAALLAMMNDRHRDKVDHAIEQSLAEKRRLVGGVYKRTRDGRQRAEVRFDDIAGCLRTPKGGSSRQSIIVIDGKTVRSRLLSPREAARLMGLSDSYILPPNYNQAYQLAGDGVAVPVVRHLALHLLEPILTYAAEHQVAAE